MLSLTALLQAIQWLLNATQLIGYSPPGEHFGLFFFKNNNKPS